MEHTIDLFELTKAAKVRLFPSGAPQHHGLASRGRRAVPRLWYSTLVSIEEACDLKMLSVSTNDGGAGRWAKGDAKAQLSTSAAAERPLFDGMFINRFFLRSCTSHCARRNGT